MAADIGTRVDPAARARDENFPVAPMVLRADEREKLLAIYAFARLTDDVGDESDGDRLEQLDWVGDELERSASGTATHPVFTRLAPVLASLDCGVQPFRDLVEANRVDQRVHTYETFDALRGYCMLSAAPIGRMVLSVFNATTPERVARSDDVCVGLQLVEHLQDVGEDAARGRVYLPQEDLIRLGCVPDDLGLATARPALRRVVAYESARARELLLSGVALASTLRFRPKVAVIGFVAGGLAALDAIRRARGDVLGVRCRPRGVDLAWRGTVGLALAITRRST